MTHAGIASALVASVFALAAITIALCGKRARTSKPRDLWRAYFSTVAIVAAILLPAVLHPALFAVLVALAAVRCGVELLAIHGMRATAFAACPLAALMTAAVWFGSDQSAHGTTRLMAASLVVLCLILPAILRVLNGPVKGVSPWLAAAGLPALAAAHLSHVVHLGDGAVWIFMLYATVETQDSVAFLVGRIFGRTPLAPRLSPNKTVEGALAGAAAGIAMGIAIASLLLDLPAYDAVAFALLLVIGGFLGDLFTSRLKRAAGVKDFPPVHTLHGGLLDIYDSTLFAVLPLSVALWLLERAN